MIITENTTNQITEILEKRANEIASYQTQAKDSLPASVDMALHREIERLRELSNTLKVQAHLL